MGLRLSAAVVAAVSVAAFAAAGAHASLLVGRGLGAATLRVDGHGRALVGYGGRHLLAWGAVNARPPQAGVPQVAFSVRYGGSLAGGGCAPYDGPSLAWLVVACKAPDGSYWALQRWQRLRPNYGGTSGAFELRLSHWTGATAQLEVGVDWAYRRFDHLYGRLTYLGQPVYGFHATRTGSPLDAYGRNMYLDTLDSAYGSGWHRENSFLAQRPTGAFCYGFYPHRASLTGRGSTYRITAIGPGVTPDVSWQGAAPGAFDEAREAAANTAQRALFVGGGVCRAR
jgi:hypothetical protein